MHCRIAWGYAWQRGAGIQDRNFTRIYYGCAYAPRSETRKFFCALARVPRVGGRMGARTENACRKGTAGRTRNASSARESCAGVGGESASRTRTGTGIQRQSGQRAPSGDSGATRTNAAGKGERLLRNLSMHKPKDDPARSAGTCFKERHKEGRRETMDHLYARGKRMIFKGQNENVR